MVNREDILAQIEQLKKEIAALDEQNKLNNTPEGREILAQPLQSQGLTGESLIAALTKAI